MHRIIADVFDHVDSFPDIQLLSYPLYGLSITVLLVVLVAGKVVVGSKSWFGIGGLGLQPSEMVKITTILLWAYYLSRTACRIFPG